MFHTSEIRLSKSALKNNIQFLQSLVGLDVRLSSVIKGNAYGHGIEEWVPAAEEAGIRHISVFNAYEGLRAQRALSESKCSLMIMGMIDEPELEWAIENEVEIFVFDRERLEQALNKAKSLQKPVKIHMELETGLNRTGFSGKDLTSALALIKENKEHFILEGICTHYAGAEHIGNYLRIQNQIQNFKHLYKQFLNKGLAPKYRHTACSAAAISYPQTRMDMVRFGIAQYGFWPSQETYMDYIKKMGDRSYDPLKRVIRWTSKIMSVKDVPEGEFVGYGTSYLASSDMRVATIPVGYGNGFARSLSNLGIVLVNGCRAPVIGTVNMNMMMINASEVPNIKPGDEVVIIGGQGDQDISVSAFGEMSNQLNYELLTRLPLDIPRVWVD